MNAICRLLEFALNDILPFTAFLAVLVGIAAGITAFTGPRGCAAAWADYEHRWSFHRGCQIKIDSRWVPTNAVKIELRRNPAEAN